METLKKFEDMHTPDGRNTLFLKYDESINGQRPFQAKDYYEIAESITLHKAVPEQVKSNFAIAQNMYFYSWLYYPFNAEAGLVALRTTEQALKVRLGLNKSKKGLCRLTEMAIENGLLSDDTFSGRFTIDKLPEILAGFRNSPAHGDQWIHPHGSFILQLAADTINQLFQENMQ